MIPNYLGVPVEEMIWLKREELMRDLEQMRLVRAARISNPGLLERAWLLLAQALMRLGQQLHDQEEYDDFNDNLNELIDTFQNLSQRDGEKLLKIARILGDK